MPVRVERFFGAIADVLSRWRVLAWLMLQIALIPLLDRPGWITGSVFSLAVIAVTGVFLHTRRADLLLGLLSVIGISAAWHLAARVPLSENLTPKKCSYLARVVGLDASQEGKTRLTVDLLERVYPAAAVVAGRIGLTIPEAFDVSAGSVIEFNAAVKAPPYFLNPGVFNYRDFLRRQNIWGKAFVPDKVLVRVVSPAEPSWRAALRRDFLLQLNAPGVVHGPLLTALVLGRGALPPKQKQLVRNAGLSHLFAISGMNFGIMSAFVFFFVSLGTGLFPRLYQRLPRQKIAAAATMVFVIYYFALVETTPSVIRAGLMIVGYLATILSARPRHLAHMILMAAAIELTFAPMHLFDVSFQLSYLCVLVLAWVAPPLGRYFRERRWFEALPRVAHYFLTLLGVSLLLSALLLPLVLLDFGASPLAGLVNNLWAVPLFDLALVPLALVYVLWASWGLPGDGAILGLLDRVMGIFVTGMETTDAWGLPQIGGIVPWPGQVAIFYAALFLYFVTRRRLVLGMATGVLILSAVVVFYDNHLSFDLRISQIDVGQGDAILIQTRAKNLLIDTGGSPYFDMAERVLVPYFRAVGVRRLDTVVITHADMDHYGGLVGLASEIPIGAIWINDLPVRDPEYASVLANITSRGIPMRVIAAAERVVIAHDLMLDVLAPTPAYAGLSDDNDHSIVLRVTHGDFHALFTGDLERPGEKILLALYPDGLESDLLKVGHHGSATSSGARFLKAVSPKLAMIGVERNSRYGHPVPGVIERLQNVGAEVLRTDQHGMVRIDVSNGSVRVWKFSE